ncbi:MAG: sorbosone dehydrogenase family protein [Rhodospirillales bacterium]|nr:sorbosone dehydrogenase family protein [Rhodospirillales bacterium]
MNRRALLLLLLTAAAPQGDAPGTTHHLELGSLPAPYATASAGRPPRVVPRPPDAAPAVPAGFTATLFASGFDQPRTLRTAPNGDVFLAESGAGRIRILRTLPNAARPATVATFAEGLSLPFGIAFWPPGPAPRFVYVAETNRVIRYPYQSGDLRARGPAQVIVPSLPEGGHWTRDLAVSPDGGTLFVSVGSASNAGTTLRGRPPADLPRGAAWGDEAGRALVLAMDPEGGARRVYATGLRNCSAMAIQPGPGALWCVVNERDGLGDDLPPDYATRVQQGAFYGWPWFYLGDHPDPRLRDARPDLAGQVTAPDVLIQAHSAPLGITFYDGAQFPAEYRGDAFVALHGSWNRATRTGYSVIRLRFANGRPTGAYEEFLSGFVASDRAVWARPVGVTVAPDGALLVSEDGNGTIWRVAWRGTP